MKKLLLPFILLCLCVSVYAEPKKYKDQENWVYTDAVDFIANKLIPTENPYHRLDVDKYPDLTKSEKGQAVQSTGLFIAFRTDSPYIGVSPDFIKAAEATGSSAIASRGFDLYIRLDGQWRWAGSGAGSKNTDTITPVILLEDADTQEKECIIYLPNNSVLKGLQVITKGGCRIEKMPNPFKGRIAVFGSSYTHGACSSRPGMIYSSQLCRMTGYNFINMGFSGNSKLQQSFAGILTEAKDIDAYLFDAFSNPNLNQIRERLFPFIERFQKEKPGVPLIFMKTLHRERRTFNLKSAKFEADRMALADSLMKIACKKYKNVYWITTTNATDSRHETSIDGSHPGDHGYALWAESVKKPVVKIIRKRIK